MINLPKEFDSVDLEIEMEPEEFAEFVERANRESARKDEMSDAVAALLLLMRDFLSVGEYGSAFECTRELRFIAYHQYKQEIDDCIKTCADHDAVNAVIWLFEKMVNPSSGKIAPEAFPYLVKLADWGYIPSFRWIGDCYLNGIGCEHDIKKAEHYYFEGMVFEGNDYCKKKLTELLPELKNYSGDDLIKVIAKRFLCADGYDVIYVLSRFGELVIDGKIKEYRQESGIPLLMRALDTIDGFAHFKLAEYFINRSADYNDCVIAASLLGEAKYALEFMDCDYAGEDISWLLEEALRTEQDYREALEQTYKLCEAVKGVDINSSCSHEIYENWKNDYPKFIRRR